MVVAPLIQKWTCVEEHCREFFERKRRKRWILLAYEVFIKPVSKLHRLAESCESCGMDVRLLHLKTYAFKGSQLFVRQIQDETAKISCQPNT